MKVGRLRIGFLTDNYPYSGDAPPSPPGGIGTYTQLVAEELTRRGHEVHVFTFAGVARHRTIRHNGVSIWQCPAWSKRREMTLPQAAEFTLRHRNDALRLNRYSMLCAARDAAGDRHFDVIEAADLGAMGQLVKDAGLTGHYSLRLHCSTNFGRVPKSIDDLPIMKRIERAHALCADSLTAPSQYTIDMTQKVWHCDLSRALVVGNPVAGIAYEAPAGRANSIAFFGRIAWQKGVDTLVRAIGLVRTDIPDVRLTLIGPDQPWPTGESAVSHLKQLGAQYGAQANLIFAPALPYSALRGELRKHALAALPSRDETFGNAAIEAMMWGVPCVLSDIAPFREIGVEGETTLFSAVENEASLAANIVRMLSDPSLRRQLSERAYKRAQIWRVESVVDQLLECWCGIKVENAA